MRPESIAQQIRQHLSMLLLRRIKDPALKHVSINHVKVSPDLQFADIHYSFLDEAQSRKEVEAGFDRARGQLKRWLSEQIKLRRMPELRFHYDELLAQERRIGEILSSLHELDED